MKQGLLIWLSAAVLLTLASGAAFAHHAASATYVHGKSVKIEGTLEGIHMAQSALLHEGGGPRRKRGYPTLGH